jgi:hypothetical protein
MRYALKTNVHTGKLVGFPVVEAAAQYPPQIVALLKCHGIEVGGDPRPFTVQEIDRHFAENGTNLEARFACKAALRQIGQLS